MPCAVAETPVSCRIFAVLCAPCGMTADIATAQVLMRAGMVRAHTQQKLFPGRAQGPASWVRCRCP